MSDIALFLALSSQHPLFSFPKALDSAQQKHDIAFTDPMEHLSGTTRFGPTEYANLSCIAG